MAVILMKIGVSPFPKPPSLAFAETLLGRDLPLYAGYRKEPGVAKHSDVETFSALRLFIDSWRWQGAPWYLRAGKSLATTAAEVLVELKPPPQRLFDDSAPVDGRANFLRFRPGFLSTPPSPWPRASSAQARSSPAISTNSFCRTNSRKKNRPTNGSWATPWPAKVRFSPARTASRPPGRWSIPC